MKYVLEPYEGIDAIKFGMHADAIHEILRDEYKDRKVVYEEGVFWRRYEKKKINIKFDPENLSEAIEVRKPNKLMFLDIDLLSLSRIDAVNFVTNIDNSVQLKDGIILSINFGFEFVFYQNNKERIYSVNMVCKDYFEKKNQRWKLYKEKLAAITAEKWKQV